MTLTIRTVKPADRERVCEISAQIWDGDDYVPSVFDAWVSSPGSEFVVAERDGAVIAFARRSWLFPGYAWLQGIRSDPAHRGQGAGRAITEYFLAAARQEGAHALGLTTHIGNEASIHIITSYGFQPVASFVIAGAHRIELDATSPSSPAIAPISSDRAVAFIQGSAWNRIARGRYPWNWRAHPLDRAADRAISHTPYRVAVLHHGRLRSLLCASFDPGIGGEAFVSFLDGHPRDFRSLLNRAQQDLQPSAWTTMIPKDGQHTPPAYGFLLGSGWRPWGNGEEDVFAYELKLDRSDPFVAGDGPRWEPAT
jgi:GNAT superfamily N-acetyltransferase